jgi:glycosyltransferase involved in cell wall biosynthesis
VPDAPRFSVIIPVHREHPLLQEARRSIHSASSDPELIIVLNDVALVGRITAERPSEKVVLCERRGRGYALLHGARMAEGELVLLLHADTILPPGWDTAIQAAMEDPRVVGGGFHITFDKSSPWLDFLARFSDVQVRLGRSMWGDRAIFARAAVLKKNLPALDVPLFEDIRLSKALRRDGRLAFLDKTVVTSAEHFRRNGRYRQTGRILVARIWYSFGGDIGRIYDYYYSR